LEIVSELVTLLERLVSIDSVNPGLSARGAGESEIAAYVADWCRQAGMHVELDAAAPGRSNVVATARGSGDGQSLMLNAHLDTVGYAGMENPLQPRVENGRLYGRGAYDMKSGLAAAMLATQSAVGRGFAGDVILTAVVDEELSSIGTQSVLKRWRADAAIVCEPTQERVCVAHKGFVAFEIETHGRAAHGSRPDLGIDAIAKMGKVLVSLENLDRTLRENPLHPLLGSGSVHAGVIAGGREFSTYPDRCVLQAERRTVPGESVVGFEEEIGVILSRLRELDAEFEATWRTVAARKPFEVSEREDIVRLLKRLADTDEVVGETYWADSALLAELRIPTVVYGPAGEGAHAAVEWVDIASAERCAELYAAVAAEFCA
jgi:acetylornithine deacetylase